MKTLKRHASMFDLWTRFATDNTAMMLAAGEVIGHRTRRMAAHGAKPNADERRELNRMVAEKQAAMLEGSLAAWAEWARIGQANWLAAMTTARPPVHPWSALRTQLKIADAALKPVRSRVAGNRKRLSR